MNKKREISILIPYKISEKGVLVFLQKRSKDAERLPDWFGFFGGGRESEDKSPDDTLKREIREELSIDVDGNKYFSRYEFFKSIKDVYIMKVDDFFQSKIVIGEGEYGKFFSKKEVEKEKKLILEDKTVLDDFFRVINL